MIKEYQKKPIVIRAVQYPGYMTKEIEDFVGDWLKGDIVEGKEVFWINTLEGNSHNLSEGDWIIEGVDKEFYPCKPDIFEKTYVEYESSSEKHMYIKNSSYANEALLAKLNSMNLDLKLYVNHLYGLDNIEIITPQKQEIQSRVVKIRREIKSLIRDLT